MPDLHSALSRLVLEGADLHRLTAEVRKALAVSVVVTSNDGRERSASLSDDERAALTAAGLVDPSGRVRVERLPAKSPVPLAGGEVRLIEVAAAGTDLVRLVCVSPDRGLTGPEVTALQRAATVVALLVTQQHAVAAVENKYRGDFLRAVLLGTAGDAAPVLEHARGLGWVLDRPAVVVCAEVDPLPPGEPPASAQVRRAWQERFAAAWRQVCQAHDPAMPTVDFSTEVVTVVPVPAGPGEPAQEVRRAVACLVSGVAGDRGGGRRPFSVGVSRPAGDVDALAAAYTQARRAVTVGRRITGAEARTWFDDLGLHRLIALVPDAAELTSFVTDVLGDLTLDTAEAADLRTTLQILLDTNLNVAEAARLQYFHYNTMRYRVGKLERMLGPFTHDPHLRLDIAVALQVLAYRG